VKRKHWSGSAEPRKTFGGRGLQTENQAAIELLVKAEQNCDSDLWNEAGKGIWLKSPGNCGFICTKANILLNYNGVSRQSQAHY